MSAISVLGHTFTAYGSEEMLCRACGFVIWPCDTEEEVVEALRTADGLDYSKQSCPGKHHGWDYKALKKAS